MQKIIRKIILKNFFNIPLASNESEIAQEAIEKKYAPSLNRALSISLLMIPATILLDTDTMISVLIPITMVAGTAWFSVSLASMKKKFENFGLELTLNLFTAFVLSLLMLFFLTLSSLTSFAWKPIVEQWGELTLLKSIAAVLASGVVFYLMWYIFNGSLKYDMNDSMLSGQNEAAERFFKRSLSILHKTADNLRNRRSPQVANYSIGVSFYEVYSIMSKSDRNLQQIENSRKSADLLIRQPAMPVANANAISLRLITEFLEVYTENNTILITHKSYIAISDELYCLKNNEDEDQEMTDMRLSVVFEEMANLIEEFGDRLFTA